VLHDLEEIGISLESNKSNEDNLIEQDPDVFIFPDIFSTAAPLPYPFRRAAIVSYPIRLKPSYSSLPSRFFSLITETSDIAIRFMIYCPVPITSLKTNVLPFCLIMLV